MSASCSMEPLSRRSESRGVGLSRASAAPRQLRASNDREPHFSRDLLERAGDFRDFLDPVITAAGPFQQLQVVHNE